MGQPIKVEAAPHGAVAIYSTDRSITGQDGASYASADEAVADERFPGVLAQRLFEADDKLSSIFMASNQIVVKRGEDWDEAATAAASAVIEDFFLFYPDV
jgi:hypothetical protein